jgi:hypothetical protein
LLPILSDSKTNPKGTQVVTIKIYLKGWADGRLYADAVNDPRHELHEAAMKVYRASYREYEPGDEYYLATTYTDADAEDRIHCERAFERFNVGDERVDEIVRTYRAYGYRSLSVGDVVVVNDRAYTCASVGWKLLPTFSSE